MKTVKLEEILGNKDVRNEIIEEMKTGSIFVYPTDTVYGIGCNALISASVKKIRGIKKSDHPFSVIAPSTEWILKNLVVESKRSLNVLPGPYTLIFRKKEPFFLRDVSPLPTLGIRIPSHPITKIVREIGIPFVSTSANLSGKQPIKKVSQVKFPKVNFVIDGGVLSGPPSIVIDLSGEEEKVIRGELRYKKG
ncbi:MAG: L-threonylcarbamoyladenylate synthase [Candidatus Aenigmarchaeota archaeon]|nr:L-threonylcarbamoyladenylate synthase [Candidatus Aenigmarchaeota archaeon]